MIGKERTLILAHRLSTITTAKGRSPDWNSGP